MSYTITVKINKPISREQTFDLIKKFPKSLINMELSDQFWGLCGGEMDVMFDENEEPKKEVELHAAYGIDYETFLIETIRQLCKAGYRIVNLKFDM